MLTIVRIHNELLGTYGDRGNADVLAFRAKEAGVTSTILDISYRDPMPESGDIYLLGGAEDAAQALSLAALKRDGVMARIAKSDSVLLAICAGFQIIGTTFVNGENEVVDGLGLLDVSTVPGKSRCVGDVKIFSDLVGIELTGFENHGGVTTIGSSATAFGKVIVGRGNGDGVHDGAVSGNVFGTYLHGPVLARNPEFADFLLARATGMKIEKVTDPLADEYAMWRRSVTK